MGMDLPAKRPGQQARTERIEIRVSKAGREAIAAAAEREDRTFSDMVRVLLSRGLTK